MDHNYGKEQFRDGLNGPELNISESEYQAIQEEECGKRCGGMLLTAMIIPLLIPLHFYLTEKFGKSEYNYLWLHPIIVILFAEFLKRKVVKL